jgi:hypothetical protein
MKTVSLSLFLFSLFLFACRKDSFITSKDARVTLTVDTLKYDTVFTSVGSVTQFFMIKNENKQKLRISSVKLMGGSASPFRINVDGFAASETNNLEIEANDSVYVFVQVNVNPNAANLPFVLRDSVQVQYNGNTRWVQLEAWGQNAHFLRNKEVIINETWTNDIPYVLLGYLHVNQNTTLTIDKGCRVYVHGTAPVIIDGTLQLNGLKDTADRVYFRGDRLDDPYKDFPAAWPGLFFTATSKDNVLNYAVLKNGYQTIAVLDPPVNANPKVRLNQCVIDNSYDAGIIAVNSSVTAINCLISNCGKNIAIAKGGTYRFTHCTAASYSNTYINHKDPVLTVSNSDGTTTAALDASFVNCIFWGENGLVDNEVIVSKSGATPFTVNFDHALWKVETAPANITSAGIINNRSPQFDSINVSDRYYNFRLKTASPAIDAGINSPVLIDLDGKTRPIGLLPDLGCFEK